MIYILAIITGFFVNVTPIMNGVSTKAIGTYRTSLFHFFSAVVTGVLAFLLLSPMSDLGKISSISPVYLTGGFIGLFVVSLMNYYAPKLEALYVAVLPFLGQMTMGLVLDYFAFESFDIQKVFGMLIILVGIVVAKLPSKQPAPNLTGDSC
ncbi:DMT family transporter [Fusibacter sp. JL298sf-3]